MSGFATSVGPAVFGQHSSLMAASTPRSLIRNVLRDPAVPVAAPRSPRASRSMKTPVATGKETEKNPPESEKAGNIAPALGTDPRNLIRAVAKKVTPSVPVVTAASARRPREPNPVSDAELLTATIASTPISRPTPVKSQTTPRKSPRAAKDSPAAKELKAATPKEPEDARRTIASPRRVSSPSPRKPSPRTADASALTSPPSAFSPPLISSSLSPAGEADEIITWPVVERKSPRKRTQSPIASEEIKLSQKKQYTMQPESVNTSDLPFVPANLLLKKPMASTGQPKKASRKKPVSAAVDGGDAIEKPQRRTGGLPSSHLVKLFARYAPDVKLSKESKEELVSASEKFLEQLSEDLAAFAKHGKRKTVDRPDFELLLSQQKLGAKRKLSLDELVREHLTAELREKVIPIARAGNRIVPS